MSGFDSKLVPGSLMTQKQFMIYRRCKIDSVFTGFHDLFFSKWEKAPFFYDFEQVKVGNPENI